MKRVTYLSSFREHKKASTKPHATWKAGTLARSRSKSILSLPLYKIMPPPLLKHLCLGAASPSAKCINTHSPKAFWKLFAPWNQQSKKLPFLSLKIHKVTRNIEIDQFGEENDFICYICLEVCGSCACHWSLCQGCQAIKRNGTITSRRLFQWTAWTSRKRVSGLTVAVSCGDCCVCIPGPNPWSKPPFDAPGYKATETLEWPKQPTCKPQCKSQWQHGTFFSHFKRMECADHLSQTSGRQDVWCISRWFDPLDMSELCVLIKVSMLPRMPETWFRPSLASKIWQLWASQFCAMKTGTCQFSTRDDQATALWITELLRLGSLILLARSFCTTSGLL